MSKIHLHIDIETYSEIDIKKAGAHAYAEHDSFEILIVAFSIGTEQTQCYSWDDLPEYFFEMLEDDNIIKVAHNAAFERTCFNAMGYFTQAKAWRCTMVKALYCGLPGSLDQLSTILGLTNAKLKSGTALINYWCKPVKPTKINGGRTRNLPEHNPEKWAQFIEYCIGDVNAEKEILRKLSPIKMPLAEWELWALDQEINDNGVKLDTGLLDGALFIDGLSKEALNERLKEITQLDNPNSLEQLKRWVSDQTSQEVKQLTKDAVKDLLKQDLPSAVREVLQIRQQTGKTSVKKYSAMGAGLCEDGRVRGLFQFYGANRTGRWAGRRVQLQNLPRHSIKDMALARNLVKSKDFGLVDTCYSDIPDTLSQLIRSAIVPEKGFSLVACDFSAIEARVLSWMAGETWRLDVFATHGKIYEASASKMFNIPIDEIDKDSPYRQRGKVAELALGYQGGVNALVAMGGDRLGLSSAEMDAIVKRWRVANPKITALWSEIGNLALLAVKNGKAYRHELSGVLFSGSPNLLKILLPSGRELVYFGARIARNRFGNDAIQYKGVDDAKRWGYIDTYGGKLVENIVQAISRDLLAIALIECKKLTGAIVLHVHDEIGLEVPKLLAEHTLEKMELIMSTPPTWAKSLPLAAEGFIGDFYRK